jgi:hypothetical protein
LDAAPKGRAYTRTTVGKDGRADRLRAERRARSRVEGCADKTGPIVGGLIVAGVAMSLALGAGLDSAQILASSRPYRPLTVSIAED